MSYIADRKNTSKQTDTTRKLDMITCTTYTTMRADFQDTCARPRTRAGGQEAPLTEGMDRDFMNSLIVMWFLISKYIKKQKKNNVIWVVAMLWGISLSEQWYL